MPETMNTPKVPKRLIIKEAIEAGGATAQSLMDIAKVNAPGLASQLGYLRLMGFCAVKDKDGVYSFITAEEWENRKAERAANAVSRKTTTPKTPAERLAQSEKRLERTKAARDAAQKRYEADMESEEVELRYQKANIEFRLAEIEHDKVVKSMPDVSTEQEPELAPEPNVKGTDLEDDFM